MEIHFSHFIDPGQSFCGAVFFLLQGGRSLEPAVLTDVAVSYYNTTKTAKSGCKSMLWTHDNVKNLS